MRNTPFKLNIHKDIADLQSTLPELDPNQRGQVQKFLAEERSEYGVANMKAKDRQHIDKMIKDSVSLDFLFEGEMNPYGKQVSDLFVQTEFDVI